SCQMALAPSPTLFPYTTLFRSKGALIEAADVPVVLVDTVDVELVVVVLEVEVVVVELATVVISSKVDEVVEVVVELHRVSTRGRDRKSTRLNSSHVKISYAVFC